MSAAASKLPRVLVRLGLIGGIGLFAAYHSLYNVEGGHRAIVFNHIHGVKDRVYTEGTHLMIPWFERPIVYDVRARPHLVESTSGSRHLQMVKIGLRVLTRPEAQKLPTIYRTLGRNYNERVLPSITHETLKSVVARYNASQLLTQREKVSAEIRDVLNKRAANFNIALDDVSITSLTFGKEFTSAIEAKQIAAQEAERAKYIVEKAEQDKKGAIIRAQMGHGKSNEDSFHVLTNVTLENKEPGDREQRVMAEEEATTLETTLEFTPTWAVATVCFILILVSILLEHLLNLLGKYFNRKRRKSLIQALDKIKSELMLLGFVSLLLTVSQRPIAKICISKSVGETFLPCTETSSDAEEETICAEKGMVSLLSRQGVEELQYLIFVLAFFHVLSCVLTFSLGMAKMKRWESWEAETRTLEYQFLNDPRRFQLSHQTSFGKRHLKFWSDHRFLRWPACFFRQFFHSVYKVDYFTLRHGFIMAHFTEGTNFDFQKYIRRALEKDFGVVVGISWWIWIFSVFFLFFNAHVFHNYLWLPFFPLVMLLVVGTKLQGIITKMCLESPHVVRGPLLVKPNDNLFWFGKPKLLLHLIYFILYQNSFQIAFFMWTWYKFGFRSCFHKQNEDIIIRLAMGVVVQILCAYVTLPLYALVTQMGTSMGKAVFTESVAEGLKKWRAKAKKNLAMENTNHLSYATTSLDASLDTSLETSLDHSPSFTLAAASFSLERDGPNPISDSEIVALEIEDEEQVNGKGKQKVSSFNGFDRATPAPSQNIKRESSS